jgi:hypothetical protein
MPALERRISLRGPRFWRDGAVLMFERQLDGSTREGPRPATDADRAAWPEALAAADTLSAEAPGERLVSARDPAHRRTGRAR